MDLAMKKYKVSGKWIIEFFSLGQKKKEQTRG